MLDSHVSDLITYIHATPPKLVFEFAGAGSLALAWLHSIAGSSRTILEASDRYTPISLASLVGATPEKFVSRETAEAMAQAAYRRATQLAEGDTICIGVGCTATIATDRVKRGDHGCWVAVQSAEGVRAYGLVLEKGARSRAEEEAVVSELVIQAIAEACGAPAENLMTLQAEERIDTFSTIEPDPIAQLLAGTAQFVTVLANDQRIVDAPVPQALLSGSFNPLHIGHERLAQTAATLLGVPVTFELPVLNADKPPLTHTQIEQRLAQFRWRYPVALSRAPLFVQKATLYPSCVFVIGYDTAARIVEPRYYGGETERDAALSAVQAQWCSFLVAGRAQGDGFLTLQNLAVPAGFATLFRELPEDLFRVDLSSTAIRAAQTNKF